MIARGHTHSARVDALFSFLEEHGDYLAKQMVIFVDFYRQHGADEAATNPSITRAVARFREFIQFYLQIDDPELVTMVECLLNGYVLVIMGPHAHFSIKNQSVLLKKLLESYRSA